MERVYRVVSLQKSGGKMYWEPLACSFLYEKFPTNEYSKYSDALREYRNAISSVGDDYVLSVSLEERHKTSSAWHTMKERKFTRNSWPPLMVSNEVRNIGQGMQVLSNRSRVVSGLPKISEKSREELALMSKQLDSLSFLAIKLQYKIFEELKDGEELDDVQDAEN